MRQSTFKMPAAQDEDAEIIRPYITDKEIIEMFNRRDERALSEMQQKYGKYCTAVAVNILKNREDAELAVNDALMRLWERIPPERPDNLAGFAAKTTKFICLNRYTMEHTQKRGANETRLILDELSECIPSGVNVEGAFERKELIAAINTFVSGLPQKKRNIFILRYWYRMSVKDISKRIGISENSISVIILRIRKKLTENLKRRGML